MERLIERGERVFDYVILQDLTLSNGIAEETGTGLGQGGAIFSRGALQIDNVTFNNNLATGFNGAFAASSGLGGAIYVAGTATVGTIFNTNFSGNLANGGNAAFGATGGGIGAVGYGSAIYTSRSITTITGSTFPMRAIFVQMTLKTIAHLTSRTRTR